MRMSSQYYNKMVDLQRYLRRSIDFIQGQQFNLYFFTCPVKDDGYVIRDAN